MRILRLAQCYRAYLEDFYAQRPGLAARPYAEQYPTLMDDCFGWGDAWSRTLTPLGYEIWEPVLGAETMQRSWAREQGLAAETLSLREIALAQATLFKPDVILCNLWDFDADAVQQFKHAVPSIRLIAGRVGSALPPGKLCSAFDVVLCSAPETVRQLRAAGATAEFLPLAFHTRVLELLGPCKPTIDFTFIGSIVRGRAFHGDREVLLARIAERVPIEIFSPQFSDYGEPSSFQTRSRCLLYDLVHGPLCSRLPRGLMQRAPLVRRVLRWRERPESKHADLWRRTLRPPLWGLEAYRALQSSRVTLNTHADSSPTHASNMRLFEATGVGTCLVTDWKQNLKECFEPDREVVTYRSAEECIEKVQYLLDHEPERRAIAAAGQRRTLQEHTFEQRAPVLDEILRRYMSARSNTIAVRG